MLNIESILKNLITSLKFLLNIKPSPIKEISNLNSFLIVCPHFNLGQLISNGVLLKSLRKKYPNSKITIILNSEVSEKLKRMLSIKLMEFQKIDEIVETKDVLSILSKKYDFALVPSLIGFSALSHLILRFVKSENKIGISKIDQNENPFNFLFNIHAKVTLNDNHVSDAQAELSRLLGISFIDQKFTSRQINISESEKEQIKIEAGISENQKVILLNNVPEEIANKWGVENLVNLITSLVNSGNYFFYYIEDKIEPDVKNMLESDVDILNYVDKNNYSDLVKIFSICDLIITCESNLMHFAGLTNVPQISIFGMGNPFNWAPIGSNKKFIKKSDLINDVSGRDVFEISQELFKSK